MRDLGDFGQKQPLKINSVPTPTEYFEAGQRLMERVRRGGLPPFRNAYRILPPEFALLYCTNCGTQFRNNDCCPVCHNTACEVMDEPDPRLLSSGPEDIPEDDPDDYDPYDGDWEDDEDLIEEDGTFYDLGGEG